MPVHSAFDPNFWQPYVSPLEMGVHAAVVNRANEVNEASGENGAQPSWVIYSQEQHDSHDYFRLGEIYQKHQEEVLEALSFLILFCEQHGMPDAPIIKQNFHIFFNHWFVEFHYFDTRAELLDSIGKQSLGEFCSMIRNEAIDLEVRKHAIRNLSQGVTLCADGALSNLVSAACRLAKAAGGLRGKLWELKEEMAGALLQQAMEKKFGGKEHYHRNEIHYVNTSWNLLADAFGLQKTPDHINMPEVAEPGFVAECQALLAAALTPDRFSLFIAETCQTRFNARMTANSGQAYGQWNSSTQDTSSEELEEIGNEFGLTSEDELNLHGVNGAAEAPVSSKSNLNVRSFLKLEEDLHTGTYTYTLRAAPSLIALDILRTMSDLKLLCEENCPRNAGEWIDKDGMHAALFRYGELAWVARIPADDEAFETPVWRSRNAEFELVTVPDLLQWAAARNHSRRPPPAPALEQAIRITQADKLIEMPVSWLGKAEHMGLLLQRLNTGHAKHYLLKNLSGLGPLGAHFSSNEHIELLIRMMRIDFDVDMCNVIRMLARHWCQIPEDGIYSVLRFEAIPLLHRAMLQEDPHAAVGAWYQTLRDSALLTLVAPRLAGLLNTRHEDSKIFAEAIANGRATAITAFYALVKNLLKDPTTQAHIAHALPQVLGVYSLSDDPYPLVAAMAYGHIAALKAFYAGLKDLLTDPGITIPDNFLYIELLDLLIGGNGTDSALMGALCDPGHAATIEVFHTALNDLMSAPRIAPHIRRGLPNMLAMRNNVEGLWYAMRAGRAAAIEAFYALLKDPNIRPHIRPYLPGLLAVRHHTPGLAQALENGHAAVIKVFHATLKELLSDPDTVPYIQYALPELLAAKDEHGIPGLSYARGNEHTETIKAFQDMVADPVIRPHIEKILSWLLSAAAVKRVSYKITPFISNHENQDLNAMD